MSTQQAASAQSHRSREFLDEVRETVAHPVQSHPISTTLLVFGAGLGLGALIGSMITESAPPKRHMSQAEMLGRSLLDSLSAAMPDALARHLK